MAVPSDGQRHLLVPVGFCYRFTCRELTASPMGYQCVPSWGCSKSLCHWATGRNLPENGEGCLLGTFWRLEKVACLEPSGDWKRLSVKKLLETGRGCLLTRTHSPHILSLTPPYLPRSLPLDAATPDPDVQFAHTSRVKCGHPSHGSREV